ncbi:LysR family transcriptional regulator [Sphingobium estronivorans]|uniref:LysR family transcriptional regulator n=1 Tax=Sphingobium estronivorans TaxID=1577690 RepID=UPI0013C363BA|nr:LysR family transcriptional regulator [Sphingobium estronivorans]
MDNSKMLRLVNLNLLPVLRQLLKTRSVSRTAEDLNLTQSAISASLRKLRELFSDELLVMRGREMVLTERAENLVAPLEALMASAEHLIGIPEFDPATEKRMFRIASADYITALIAPGLLPYLAEHAPGISIQIVIGGPRTSLDIQQGVIDLIIAPDQIAEWLNMPFQEPDSPFDHEILLHDRLVCIAAQDDPDIDDRIDMATYLSKQHASFYLRREIHASVEIETMQRLGLHQKNQLFLQEFTLLPMIVAATRNIAVIPETIANIYAKVLPIKVLEPPVEFEPIKLAMVWAKSQSRKPAHSWFRDAVRKAIRQNGDS